MKALFDCLMLLMATLHVDATTNEAGMVRVELRDGSVLVGQPVTTNLVLRTGFADLSLNAVLLREVDLADGASKAVIHLQNGDRLRGTLALPELRIEALIGPVGIKLDVVKRIRFLPAGAAANRVRLRIFMDGRTELHFCGPHLWFVHRSWMKPGDGDSTHEMSFVNDQEWDPDWQGNVSAKSAALATSLPAIGASQVKVEEVKARGVVEVKQQPREENGYTAIILMDDASIPSQAWYEFVVAWEP